MDEDNRSKAYQSLVSIAEKQGYVTFDDIDNISDQFLLSIDVVNLLADSLLTNGIIVYDEMPSQQEELADNEYDYAQSDYDSIFDRVLKLNGGLSSLIGYVKSVKPAQKREFDSIKYQAQEGNAHARQRIIDMHLRIAIRLALQRAELFEIDIEDAISEAIIGLLYAVDKYNPDENGAMASYVSFWVLQNLNRTQMNKRPLIYYPFHRREDYLKTFPLIKKRGCLECDQRLYCKELMDLVSEKLSCSIDETYDTILQFEPIESIDMVFYHQKDSHYYVDSSFYKEMNDSLLKENINSVLCILTEREEQIIRMRYGIDNNREMTLEEIGQVFDLTRERIRQIESKALRKLQSSSVKHRLSAFYYDL